MPKESYVDPALPKLFTVWKKNNKKLNQQLVIILLTTWVCESV